MMLLFEFRIEEWLATSVSIAITYLVFIMGLPALFFQTFIADAYRNIYNERLGQNYRWLFVVQIVLICLLFIQSNALVVEGEVDRLGWKEEWIGVGVFSVVLVLLIAGFYYLVANFNATRNIETRLSKRIAADARKYYDEHRRLLKKDLEDLAVLAKELRGGTRKNTFLEACEDLLEHILNDPKNKDARVIGDLLEHVICLSITYDGAQFNHENIKKVMDILNLAFSKTFRDDQYRRETYLKSTIANCIKEIAVKAMRNNDLASVMDAVEKLTVIDGTANEMYVLGNEALLHQHIKTTVTVVRKLTGKLQQIALFDDNMDYDKKRIFFFWLGLVAKFHQLDGSAREFGQRQIKNVVKHLDEGHRKELNTLFEDAKKNFYQQADFKTIDAIQVLQRDHFGVEALSLTNP